MTTLKILTLFFLSLNLLPVWAQTRVSGIVTDADSGEPLAGVNIVMQDKVLGTTTNTEGIFTLQTKETPPFTLVFSSIGYATQTVEITSRASELNIRMEEQTLLGREVVVSASRLEESILESPVSIEKLDILALRQGAAPSFYDQLINLKGIDVSAQSLTFKSVNPRGFGANGNTRTVQLIDGIDN